MLLLTQPPLKALIIAQGELEKEGKERSRRAWVPIPLPKPHPRACPDVKEQSCAGSPVAEP